MFKVGDDRKAAQIALATRDRCPRASSRPSTWSRARSRPAPTCRTPTSTPAARRASPTCKAANDERHAVRLAGPGLCRAAGGRRTPIYDVVTEVLQRRDQDLRRGRDSSWSRRSTTRSSDVLASRIASLAAAPTVRAGRLRRRGWRPHRSEHATDASRSRDAASRQRRTSRDAAAAIALPQARAGAELRAHPRLRLRLHPVDGLSVVHQLQDCCPISRPGSGFSNYVAACSSTARAGTSRSPTSASSRLLYIVICLALGLCLAILLDQKIRGEGMLRPIYLYPMALSFIVTGVGLEVVPRSRPRPRADAARLGLDELPFRLDQEQGLRHLHAW